MATASQDFSSKRHFHYTQKLADQDDAPQSVAVSRLRSAVLAVLNRARSAHHHHQHPLGLGPRVVGTLFGNRRGHVHLAFQKDPTSRPAFLIELATPISTLVREMASGLVRITLECEKLMNEEEEKKEKKKKSHVRLLEEAVWKTYCNGKKCGFATRRDCGAREWEILKAVEPISMGAGVLPGDESGSDHHPSDGGGGGGGGGGEVMYMRAKFERIVGSRDSEAFYMMNPDSNGAPELSLYLLRV
ncbi:protein MIZU-KUSSEI 1 [Senna tora]|uniref:Protein MIZU-KUSSEI 1 n=1 Tax=Senna tora TaxID=362788 RepID=A0A834X5D9_9FABA|nr:protein MIZU-KUSSEI 1 [Senna tora]